MSLDWPLDSEKGSPHEAINSKFANTESLGSKNEMFVMDGIAPQAPASITQSLQNKAGE